MNKVNNVELADTLLTLGNEAKDLGLYEHANEVFAVILAQPELCREVYLFLESAVALPLEDQQLWAQQLTPAVYLRESYYDLAVIESWDTELKLCIPIPLLTAQAAIQFYVDPDDRRERLEHNRQLRADVQPEEIQDFTERLKAALDKVVALSDCADNLQWAREHCLVNP